MDGQLNEKQIMELFDGFTATPADDADVKGFDEPIKGKYEAEIKSIEYKDIKTKDGRDFEVINLKLKITKDVAGDVSLMRNVDKSYFMGVSQWNEDPIAGYKQLLNDLASAGLYHEGMKTGDIRGRLKRWARRLLVSQYSCLCSPRKTNNRFAL